MCPLRSLVANLHLKFLQTQTSHYYHLRGVVSFPFAIAIRFLSNMHTTTTQEFKARPTTRKHISVLQLENMRIRPIKVCEVIIFTEGRNEAITRVFSLIFSRKFRNFRLEIYNTVSGMESRRNQEPGWHFTVCVSVPHSEVHSVAIEPSISATPIT